jgi:alkyl hydroperoxide reductase subunit F
MNYDLIIVGGGPAGAAAAVYAGRKQLKTLLITDNFGGQSLVSNGIENWIGTLSITGYDLARALENHVRAQEMVELSPAERVSGIQKTAEGFIVSTDQAHQYQGRAVLVTSGGRRRRLGVSGENEFDGRGVVFCSTCDAPFFRNKVVAVVGAGNAGLEAVVDLFPYATKIYLLNRRAELKGDPLTQGLVEKSEKVTIIHQVVVTEILGNQVVKSVKYKHQDTDQIEELPVDGVFIEIGSIPNSEFLQGVVELNELGEVIIDHKTCETSVPGLFAAGDVTDEMYKQNNIAVGDAIKGTLSAYNYLLKQPG